MKNINKLSKIVAASLGTVATLGMLPQAAAETVSLQATVDVLNTFTLVQDNQINFGTIRAKASTDGANTAFITLPANATTNASVGTAVGANNTDVPGITELTAGSPGQYSVSGAASFTSLTISVDADSVNLTGTGIPPGKPTYLQLGTLRVRDSTGAETPLNTTGTTLPTIGDGTLTFTVGGTLSTQDTADLALTDGNYADGTYAGSLVLTVVY